MTRVPFVMLALVTACAPSAPTPSLSGGSTLSPSLGGTVAPASTPPPSLPPIPARIAEFLTTEGVAFERGSIEPSITLNRVFMPGLWAWDNTVRSPWGEFRFSDDLVLLGYSVGYYGAPEPTPGDPTVVPADVARAWLARHRPDLVELIGRGLLDVEVEASPAATYFHYTRVRGAGEVSVFPLEASVTIVASCNCVESFQGGKRDFARTTPPQLDEAVARALIQQRYRRVSIDRLYLEEELTESGSFTVYVAQLTVALPGVYDTHPHILWVFDADTGETVRRLGDPTEANIERPLPDGVSP